MSTTSAPLPHIHRDTDDSTTGPGAWLLEAEAHLRQAGRALEMLGLVDQESARMALVAYRLASRIRSDRIAR